MQRPRNVTAGVSLLALVSFVTVAQGPPPDAGRSAEMIHKHDPDGDGSADDCVQYPLDGVRDLFGVVYIVEDDKEGRGRADDSRRHVQDIADRDQDDDSDDRSEEIHRKIQSQKIFDGYQGDPEYTGDSIASDTTDSMME